MSNTVLFVCNEYPPYRSGGIGMFVQNTAEFITKQGFTAVVAGIYAIDRDVEEEINSVKVFRYKRIKKKGWLSEVRSSLAEKRLLSNRITDLEKKFKPKFIESFEWSGPLYRAPNTKLIVRLHGSHTVHAHAQHKQISKWILFWEKRNYHMADAVVSVSNYMLNASEQYFGKRNRTAQVIYNGIDTQRFHASNTLVKREHELLFAGRFHEQKGVYELPAVLKELFALDSRYTFLFVGHHNDAQKETWLQQFSPEEQTRIRFIAGVQQAALVSYYQTCAAVLVPSRGEAFGLVAAEAMACGAVVIMNNNSSAPELVTHREDGLLVHFQVASETALTIHQTLIDNATSERIRIRAQQKVTRCFSNEVVMPQNMALYQA